MIEALAANGFGKETWEGAGLWIDLIRVPPSGTWERRRADLYGLAPSPPGELSEEDGLRHLVARYLGGFGPAAVGDISSWSGVPIGVLRGVLDQMRLTSHRDRAGGELLDLPGRRLPDESLTPPVRFLPTWDATLLAHARRALILPEEYRNRVFNTKSPQSFATFLVDGVVAGTWEHSEGRLRTEPFAPIPRPWRRDVDEEASRLARFLAD